MTLYESVWRLNRYILGGKCGMPWGYWVHYRCLYFKLVIHSVNQIIFQINSQVYIQYVNPNNLVNTFVLYIGGYYYIHPKIWPRDTTLLKVQMLT